MPDSSPAESCNTPTSANAWAPSASPINFPCGFGRACCAVAYSALYQTTFLQYTLADDPAAFKSGALATFSVDGAVCGVNLNPVAVNYQCWAARRASAHIDASGDIDYDREF